MLSVARHITMPRPVTRSFAMAALMGATMLASPLSAARADTVANAAFQLAQAAAPQSAAPQSAAPQSAAPQSQAGAAATATKGETVEQRITALHTALKITSDEESNWTAVAQAMRENAAAIDKLATESRTAPPQSMTALDDLKMYQKFAQAHVDGLKNLISSFSTLYTAMPDAQKKIADTVFQSAHQAAHQSAGAARGKSG